MAEQKYLSNRKDPHETNMQTSIALASKVSIGAMQTKTPTHTVAKSKRKSKYFPSFGVRCGGVPT
ncbi:MAG: hypothetical protein LBI79_01485 [Nitrososphaerota archaeon]|jgi:hypothetical protein|nr:hypothetical protein [Nitrososphaerota archaeon]